MPVKYSKLDQGSLDVNAVSRDISVNGIRLVVDHKMSLGAKLRLRFHLPGQSGDVTLVGKLIWQADDPVSTGKVDCGIQYCDADPAEVAKINSFISGQLKFLLVARHHGSGGLKPVKDALARPRRISWDKSPVVSPPDFLTHEINLPGDGVRYCRLKREVSVYYALEGKIIQEIASLNQYVSSKSAWLLLDRMLTHSMAIKLTIAIPGESDPVKVFGWVEKIVSRTYQDERQSFILHATKVKFRDISKVDRARLVRSTYAAGNEYALLRDDPPPEWA